MSENILSEFWNDLLCLLYFGWTDNDIICFVGDDDRNFN